MIDESRWTGGRLFACAVLGCSLLACSGHPDEGTPVKPGTGVETVPGNGEKVVESRALPIMGGTLMVDESGALALASDPDRDAVFVADLRTHEVTTITLKPGEIPGRLVEDGSGNAWVVLRAAGQLAKISLSDKSLTGRLEVCESPRGLAYEAATDRLHVACQNGLLMSFDATSGELSRQIRVADDLRDVVVSGDHLVLTTFRSAEVIVVDGTGQIAQRAFPATHDKARSSVAWRAVGSSTGEVRIMHQVADTEVGVSTGPSGYGEGGSCSSSIVTPALTTLKPGETGRYELSAGPHFMGSAGPTDIAVSKTGRIAVVVAGNAWTSDRPSVIYPAPNAASDPFAACNNIVDDSQDNGEPVAVAFDSNGHSVVQSREPAALYLENGTVIPLSGESRASTGLALFHMNTGSGIACASCHPEGTDDSRTWIFDEIGPRRTQMVAGGITARAPFHWDGDMADFKMLVDEVMVRRMNLPVRPNKVQMAGFVAWVDTIERPAPRVGASDAVARGKELFFDDMVGCNDCHTGPALTNNRLEDVGTGGHFVVPTLLGIASRAPYIHDGCAKTLHERFSACGGGDKHGKTSHLTADQIDDLVAYLETL